MNIPVISVILPLYKEKIGWIRLSIESILSQTYQNFELLLINDNPDSEENVNLIKEYENFDIRVRGIFHEKNMGLSRTLNHAVKFTKGLYIARMDADDISMPNRFEEQLRCMENNPDIGVVGSYAVEIDEFGNIKGTMCVYEKNDELKAYTIFETPFIHPSVMFRKSVLLDNPYDENCRIWQDRELWCRLKDKTEFYNIPKVLIKYRISSFQAPQKAGKNISEESMRYCTDKVVEYWNLGNQYAGIYFRIASYKAINDEELYNFFNYLLTIFDKPASRYFILKKYMICIIAIKKYKVLYNPIIKKYPKDYIRVLFHSFFKSVFRHL